MTQEDKKLLLARIAAVKGTISDELIRAAFGFIEEIAETLDTSDKRAGFRNNK